MVKQQPRFTKDTVFDETDLDHEPVTLPNKRVLDEAGAEQYAREVLARRKANLVPGGQISFWK